MAKNLLDFIATEYAKGFVDHMPESQKRKLNGLTNKTLEIVIGAIYDNMEDKIKRQFIRVAIAELKKGGV